MIRLSTVSLFGLTEEQYFQILQPQALGGSDYIGMHFDVLKVTEDI